MKATLEREDGMYLPIETEFTRLFEAVSALENRRNRRLMGKTEELKKLLLRLKMLQPTKNVIGKESECLAR
jgi:hypothetical protein